MTIGSAQYINSLCETATNASLNYDIWWALKSSDTRPLFVNSMNRYKIYFSVAINSHFMAFVVGLYMLYEKRSDTTNIPNALKVLKSNREISGVTQELVCTLYNEAKPIWVKICVLRNNFVGHNSSEKAFDEIFRVANIKPDEIKALIEITKKLLTGLADAFDTDFHPFVINARDDTLSMLTDLNSFHEI